MADFVTLLVHLAFNRENPRYSAQLAGAPKLTQETVPVLQCVKNLFGDSLQRMRTGDVKDFRNMLKGDAAAQKVTADYDEKIEVWLASLSHGEAECAEEKCKS